MAILRGELTAIGFELDQRLNKHGFGICVSAHEVLGMLVEEMAELTEAVKSDDPKEVLYELSDVLVAALFGIVSIRQLNELDRSWHLRRPA